MSSLTAPSFILSPVSLCEYSAYWGEHPDVFVAPALESDPEKRFLLVLKWFIATLKGQFSARKTNLGSEKKPFNPILGELFLGRWPDHDNIGETILISEQVSHHPPITAYHINNEKHGVSLLGSTAQKSGFNGRSITVKQVGHAVYTINKDGQKEDYLVTLPSIRIDGLWFGSPYLELVNTSYIQSSTGYSAVIEYSGKGFFSGKRNTFKATVTKAGHHTPIYVATGQWTGQSQLLKGHSTEVLEQTWWDADKVQNQALEVKSIPDQGEMESRRVWETTAKAIRDGDYDIASKEKAKVENAQRAKRKAEKEQGITHEQKYFDHLPSDPIYAELGAKVNLKPVEEEAWVFKKTA